MMGEGKSACLRPVKTWTINPVAYELLIISMVYGQSLENQLCVSQEDNLGK